MPPPTLIPTSERRLQVFHDHPLLSAVRLWDEDEAAGWLERLLAQIPWTDGSYVVAGRRIQLPRLQCWIADSSVPYVYADKLMNALGWSAEMQSLREMVEAVCGLPFNAMLANLYRDGRDAVGWHADDTADLGPAPHIASLSLGAARHFHWRPRPGVEGEAGSAPLPAGTLLLMHAPFQQTWEHAVLAEPEITGARLNLTFRRVMGAPHFC